MYNPYLPQSRQFPEAGPPPPTADAAPREKKGLSALLAGLKLEELDTGDVLLLLILLFLFLFPFFLSFSLFPSTCLFSLPFPSLICVYWFKPVHVEA